MTRRVDGAAHGSGRRLRARVRRVVGTPAFAVLVFVISLVLFHWPYLAEEERWTASHLFITMFAGWAVVIGLVFLFSLFLPASSSEDKKPPSNG
jgi:glycopeptide antibiotics resistance protein